MPTMSDEHFDGIGSRLRDALNTRTYEELDRAIAEALWMKVVPPERSRRITKELLDLLTEVAAKVQEEDLLSGCALMHVLFRFSMSLSRDQVRTNARSAGANVVLVLADVGCNVEEIIPQAAFYHSRGFTTITACWCVFPVAFQKYQEVLLATELHEHLAGGAKLFVHVCGSHGHGMWCHIASLWDGGQKPFGRLARLRDCLCGIVWEGGPPADPSSESEVSTSAGGASPQATDSLEGKPRLTLEEALTMQRELYSAFAADEFMDRLEELEETHKMGSAKFLAARNKLFLEVQSPILIKHGFEATHKGVMEMQLAGSLWNSNPDYKRNLDRMNVLLGINVEGSSEHQRRMEVAKTEVAQKAAQERYEQQAKSAGESEEVIEYEGDAAGMAECADFCLRRLLARCLPEVDAAQLLRQVKTYVLGAAGRGAFWLGDDYAAKTDSGLPLQGKHANWLAIDRAMQRPVPRLFLYSKTDKVVPHGAVEAHIRCAEREHPAAGLVFEQEVEGAHTRLWQGNRIVSEQAALGVLRKAGMLEK